MITKDKIVERLLEDKSITSEEAVILLKDNKVTPLGFKPYEYPELDDMVPYGTTCFCHPSNGGSGICGCIMGNKLVPNPKKNITIDRNICLIANCNCNGSCRQ